ncbi:MAG TPA: carbon storage regulator [Gemmataceae bacterium]|nr:carbon storage regulator [Gemmataceae bacterium]
MLVLSRKMGEDVVLPELGVVFTVLEVRADRVRVGITAPADVQVHRREVWERIRAGQLDGTTAGPTA